MVIVSITSENGLFTRAKQAQNNAIEAQEQEETTLADYENIIDESVSGTRNNISKTILYDGVAKTIGEEINLNADVTEFDYILIEASGYSINSQITTNLIDISSMFSNDKSYGVSYFHNSSYHFAINVCFPTNSTFKIIERVCNGYSNASINKIIGYKN